MQNGLFYTFRRFDFWPEYRAGRHTVNPDFGAQFFCQGACHHGHAGLGDTINGMASHWTLGVNVHEIDDRGPCRPQFTQQRLHQEIGAPQVAIHQVVPLPGLGFSWQGRVEAGSVVHQDIQPLEL